jgi:preprotein translocase subunit SecA
LTETPSGLHVIGSERHEARRIDRQLRGRCARQGDPGSSRFCVSLEDDLMRLFGSDRIAGIMDKLGLEEGEVLEHRWLNRSIETAQRRVEQQNFSYRKRTLEYDDVMNKQREIIYGFRGDVVGSQNVRDHLYGVMEDVIRRRVEEMVANGNADTVKAFTVWVQTAFPVVVSDGDIPMDNLDAERITETIVAKVKRAYEIKVQSENPDETRMVERYVILNSIDTHWQDYLRSMDNLRQGVGLRAYGQRDPLLEYKREAFDMFSSLLDQIREEIASKIFRSSVSVRSFESFLAALPKTLVHDQVAVLGRGGGGGTAAPGVPADAVVEEAIRSAAPSRRPTPKVGRNDPCPCGSGKKYKKCCGAA